VREMRAGGCLVDEAFCGRVVDCVELGWFGFETNSSMGSSLHDFQFVLESGT